VDLRVFGGEHDDFTQNLCSGILSTMETLQRYSCSGTSTLSPTGRAERHFCGG